MIKVLLILLLITTPTLNTNTAFEATFSELGIQDIVTPPLRVSHAEANLTLNFSGPSHIMLYIYACIGNSTVTMKITVNNHTESFLLESGVTQKEWTQIIEHNNALGISIINLGTDEVTVYSNSTIRIVLLEEEESEESSNTPRMDYYWLSLLIASYAAPFIITFLYRAKIEEAEEEEEEIPVIVGG